VDHLLEPGAIVIGAGEGPVFVDIYHLDALPLGENLTMSDLLLDGHVPLGVAGIADVDNSTKIPIRSRDCLWTAGGGGCIAFFGFIGRKGHNFLAFPGQIC
jgi:hypothetical protein